jgi:hypothetical protein
LAASRIYLDMNLATAVPVALVKDQALPELGRGRSSVQPSMGSPFPI